MAFQKVEIHALSNLVLHEVDPASGYSRRVIEIADNDKEIPMGTVVFRSKGASVDTPYSVATNADIHTGGVLEDVELAVVFGDALKCRGTFTTAISGNTKAVAFVRGAVQLKDHLIMEALEIADRESDDYKALKHLLELQGVIIEKTLGA